MSAQRAASRVGRALIVSGGIGGAVTALALRKAGIGSVVYEAYPTGADDIGAFLVVMSNGLDALRAVDLDEVVMGNSFPADEAVVFDHHGQRLGRRPLSHGPSGAPGARTLTRAGLYRVLHDEFARRGGRVEHGKRLVAAEPRRGGGVVAVFGDGSEADGDILVGADGLHSTTRRIIDPAAPVPRYTGLNVVYGYASGSFSFPAAPYSYRMTYGTRAFFGYTTVSGDQTWWFARLPAAELSTTELAAMTPARWKQRAIDYLADDDTPAAEVVRCTGEEVYGGNTYDIAATPTWHTASMVLVGDAVHAASPSAGQGASMAMEDGVVLAKCLRDIPEPERAFAAYEDLRRERVERLVTASASHSNTTMNSTPTPPRRKTDGLGRSTMITTSIGTPP